MLDRIKQEPWWPKKWYDWATFGGTILLISGYVYLSYTNQISDLFRVL